MQSQAKIFVIGYNKTATTTIHHLFLKNGLKSFHGKQWPVEQYQCFSDMTSGSTLWRDFYDQYPDSIFILNTRSMEQWILSRVKHCKAQNDKWGYPPTIELFTNWINARQKHYLDILRFFSKTPHRLIIVSINQPGWLEFLSQQLSLKHFDLNKNVRKDTVFKKEFISNVKSLVNRSVELLGAESTDCHAEFLIPALLSDEEQKEASDLLGLYKHNLP